jgi:hypothetical protein
VFERLNTGGKRLTAQEIRNAVYGGQFNDLIVRLSRDKVFTRVWGIPPYTKSDPSDYYEDENRQKNTLYKTMGDCQLILRFFALSDESQIQGSMKQMLDRCMERNVDCTEAEANALGEKFLSRLHFADRLFDGIPFSLSRAPSSSSRLAAGIYDGVMSAIDQLWHEREALMTNKASVQQAYWAMIDVHASTGALTGAANTASDIKLRLKLFKDLFLKFL